MNEDEMTAEPQGRVWTRVLLPLLVLLLGVGLAALFVLTRAKPKKMKLPPMAARVELVRVKAEDRPVTISGMGTVVAAEQVSLQSEVTGRVRSRAAELVPGGQVQAGQLLVSVDSQEYRYAVAQQRAQLVQAQSNLAVEAGQQRVAEQEWELLSKELKGTEEQRALALRKPQQESLKASVQAAKAALQQARLNLRRTQVKAPFNAVVQAATVQPGQLVTPATQMATLVGSDAFWVRVLVPLRSLGWLVLPTEGQAGSVARVFQGRSGGEEQSREGALFRVESALETSGRLAQLLVSVPNPLQLSEATPLPLLLGAYVKVELQGRRLSGVYAIPRAALRDGDTVWLYEDGALKIREVEIAWRGSDQVYVKSGLSDGALLVTSRIATPVEGLKLKADNAKALGILEAPAPKQPPRAEGAKR